MKIAQKRKEAKETKDLPPELPEEVELNNLDLSFQVWEWMELTGWQHLPCSGALLDQPEWLMNDLITIQGNWQKIEKMMGL